MAATKIQTQSILYTGNLNLRALHNVCGTDLMLQKKQYKINPFGNGHVITVQTPSYSDLIKKLKKHIMPMCESDFSMRYIFDGDLKVPDFKNLLKWFRQNCPNKNVIVKSIKSSKVQNNREGGPEEVYVVFVNMIILIPILTYGDSDKEIIEEAFTEVVFPWGSALSAKKVIRHQKKSKVDCDYTFNPKDYPSHPDINVFRRSSSVNYTCIDWTLEMKNLDRPVKNDAPKSSFLDSHQANFAKYLDQLILWISKSITKQELTLEEIIKKKIDDYLDSFKIEDDQYIYDKLIDTIIELVGYREDHCSYGYTSRYSIGGFIDWAQRRIEAITAALAAVESSEHDLTDLRNLMGDIESLFKKQIFKVYDNIPDNYFPQSNVQNDDQDDDDSDTSDEDRYSYASYDDEEDFE